jgi:transcription antitermination protein NusB
MASRYELREIVIQSLFECDFENSLNVTNVDAVMLRNAREFLFLESVPEFARELASGVILKRETIDEIIEKAAPEWPIEKISIIDRALLRLGIFELLFGEALNIPHKVAINEAIELSKAFGGDTSRRFVNGVLGGIYKEMSPSEEGSLQKPVRKVVTENLVGAFTYKVEDEKNKIAFIRDLFKHYTLPKGHLVEGKSDIESLMEIVQNETKINIKVEKEIGNNTYTAESKDSILKKKVVYYMCSVVSEENFISNDSALDIKWISEEEFSTLKTYKDMREMILSAFQILSKDMTK